jgi:hypothetical protein
MALARRRRRLGDFDMTRTLSLFAALALLATSSTATAAPALDAAGKCRDAGKFVAAEKCRSAKPAPKQVCKDAKGKFAKCGSPGAKPVK